MRKIKSIFNKKEKLECDIKQAILDNNLTMLKYYLNNSAVNINKTDQNYFSLLDFACSNRRVAVMKFLISYNARLGVLLFQIESEVKFLTIINDLNDANYDFNNVDKLGFTPIYYAHIMNFKKAYNKLVLYNAKQLNVAEHEDNELVKGEKDRVKNLIGNA